jgi:hypothetical protein
VAGGDSPDAPAAEDLLTAQREVAEQLPAEQQAGEQQPGGQQAAESPDGEQPATLVAAEAAVRHGPGSPAAVARASAAALARAAVPTVQQRLESGELSDALAADLCKRLYVAGMPVVTGLETPDWPIDIAIADPLNPGRLLVVIEMDGVAYSACPSVRLRDRQRPQLFERAGFAVVRVAAMDLFVDPGAEVERIRDVWRAAGGLPASIVPAAVLPREPVMRTAWPSTVSPGLPISAYSTDELDDVVAWVVSDSAERTDEMVAAEVRASLGFSVRSPRIDAGIDSAIRRVLRGLAEADPNGTIDVKLRRNAIVAARWHNF